MLIGKWRFGMSVFELNIWWLCGLWIDLTFWEYTWILLIVFSSNALIMCECVSHLYICETLEFE